TETERARRQVSGVRCQVNHRASHLTSNPSHLALSFLRHLTPDTGHLTRLIRHLPLFLLALSASMADVSSFAAPTNSAWTVQVWQTEDGLPNNNIAAL